MTTFFTLEQAASAIAAVLFPDDSKKRAEMCIVYRASMYNALCDGALIGRYPDTRFQIDRKRPGSVIAFGGCVLRERDLNAWLDGIGNGVSVNGEHCKQTHASNAVRHSMALPNTAKLAEDLAPFLAVGKTKLWLGKTLGDAARRPKLARFRVLTSKPAGALWRPSGVVLWLIKEGHMTRRFGEAALKDNYPDDYDLLND